MNLKDVDFDEYYELFRNSNEDPQRNIELLKEAAKEIPVIAKLLITMQGAMKNNAPKEVLRRMADQIDCFVALFQLEKRQNLN